jgi:phenylacetate-CoA ligase
MAAATSFPTRQAILGRQFDQLRALLPLLAGSNPFYSRKFEEADISYRIRHLGEFTDTIPFTTRQEFTEDRRSHPPFGSNLTFPLTRYVRGHQCQDAQVSRWCWLDTPDSWATVVANGTETLRAAGVEAADRIFFATCFEQRAGPWLSLESALECGALCFGGAGLEAEGQWDALCAMDATVVCGVPASLNLLAGVARGQAKEGACQSLRLVLTGGTQAEAAAVRESLAPVWPQARVCVYYALVEAGVVAFECPARPDVLHLVEPTIFPELIEPATGRSLERGQTGELVLTTLFRPGSPLLRYRTGCLVKSRADLNCECGRQQLALEGGILGGA